MNATPTSKANEPQDALSRAPMNNSRTSTNSSRARMKSSRVSVNRLQKWSAGRRPRLLRPNLARNHRLEGLRSGPSSACRWRRASLSLPWSCSRPMATRPSWLSPVGLRSSFQRHHCRRKIHLFPRSPLHLPFRSGRGGGRTPASNARGADHTAGGRAGSYRSAPRSYTVAGKVGARSREHGAQHRTAQGEPATNNQRQFKSHSGAQGEPGRDQTRAREGFRAEPAQDVIASDAADADLAQARAGVSVAARESATSTSQGVDLL